MNYDWDAYAVEAETYALFKGTTYCEFALIEEAGELAGKFAKMERGDDIAPASILKEGGDILWNVAVLTVREPDEYASLIDVITDAPGRVLQNRTQVPLIQLLQDIGESASCLSIDFLLAELTEVLRRHNFTLEQAADLNLQKLADRKARNKIHGDGDDR